MSNFYSHEDTTKTKNYTMHSTSHKAKKIYGIITFGVTPKDDKFYPNLDSSNYQNLIIAKF